MTPAQYPFRRTDDGRLVTLSWKVCRRCKKSKPTADFPKAAVNKDGLHGECRQCVSDRNRERYRRQKDRNLSSRRRLLESGGTKACATCGKNFTYDQFNQRLNGPDGSSSYCKGCIRKKVRLPRGRFVTAKSSANKRGIPFELSYEEYSAIIAPGVCCYCGESADGAGGGIDRKDSLQGYTADNCVSCCKVCNFVKFDFFTYGEMREIGQLIAKIILNRKMSGVHE